MAIYHCSIKIISRGKGKSAVAAAAYRAGEKITNEYDGITHDYTRKGGVVHTEILLPEYAPREYTDRAVLWNAVEKIEKAKNSQLAREIELALPAELTREQNISLVREYISRNFVSKGMCADICIHDKNDGNPHAHIMLTMRPFEPDGSWGAKSRKEYILDERGERVKLENGTFKTYKIDLVDWNEPTKAEEWRAAWADVVNAALEQQRKNERVDHRSYERQGVEQIPTVHMGVAATQMERRGIITECGNRNREIVVTNRQLHQLRARISHLKNWLKEATVSAAPPTLTSIVQSILESGEQRNRYGKIRNLKTAARVFDFLKENNISTLPELREKVSEMQQRFDSVHENLKFADRRLTTLDEHIRQGRIYMEHRDLYAQYRRLKPRKQPDFFEAHRAQLMLLEYAKRYLDAQLNGHELPLEAWMDERANLTAERGKIYCEFKALRAQVWDVETIRREAEQIVREINKPQLQKDTKNKCEPSADIGR